MYTFMNLCVLTGSHGSHPFYNASQRRLDAHTCTMLDYYIFMYIKLKSAFNIKYDVTLSTDICDIIVLTQNKSLYRSFYV